MDNWRDKIVAEARTWKGTPYHHKGRIKGVGVDCGGLIYEVYKRVLGIPPTPFPSLYAEDWGMHKDNNELYLDFIMPFVVEVKEPLPGDLMLFKFGRNLNHGTIYVGRGKVVHSFGKTGFGSVLETNVTAFTIGNKARLCKAFTVGEQWL